ncbi:MAG: hypothetical protein KDA92_23745 [Planctomycetales bacterium]|nr:hypothetical protein [Planctomycetales bacterium]
MLTTALAQQAEIAPPLAVGSSPQPADILAKLGFDESVARLIEDGTPLNDNDAEPLIRLLFLLPRIDVMQRFGWRQDPSATDLDTLTADVVANRLKMRTLFGRVRALRKITLGPEISQRFGFAAYYQLELDTSPTRDAGTDSQGTIQLCVRQLPARWQTLDVPEAGLPISADGFFFKLASQPNEEPRWVFVADQIGWHPQAADAQRNVTTGAARLGSAGMNVALFDDLIQGQPLVQEDREAFYQMLWTVRRMPAVNSSEEPPHQLQSQFAGLITRPKEIPGQQLRVTGTARRAVLVRVPDPDIQARYGINHYYEVEVLVPLDQLLVLHDPQDGRELTYASTFPVTLCLAELPRDMPQGDEVRQAITTDAYFLKLRSYRSEFVDQQFADPVATKRRQLSPLLIGRTLSLVHPPAPQTTALGWLLGIVIFGGFAGILLLRAWYRRGDRPFDEWRRKQRNAQEF